VRFSLASLHGFVFVFALATSGCTARTPADGGLGPVELVLLHTADTHSQLFPWTTVIGAADARRGLGAANALAEVGGFARLATLIRRERAAASRVLHLDSGDLFQGSLTFERFGGEPEVLAFDALGVDAQALGNHELDHGAEPLAAQYGPLATFPLLAANYAADGAPGVSGVLEPFAVLDAAGLRVGVIGVGNTSSVGLLRERPNELGAVALGAAGAVQGAIDALRPLVDLVIAVTHLGLSGDEALVRETSGLDVVLGGHQHIALDQPAWQLDCGGGSDGEGRVRDAWGRERACSPRRVPIVHSGAYAKFLGKLRLGLAAEPALFGPSYDPLDRYELGALAFELLPVRSDTAADSAVSALLEPYRDGALETAGAAAILGFARAPVERAGATGADSPLGSFAAEAVRRHAGSEHALIGASSLRHDLPPGAIDAETLARVMPFDDPLVRVRLSGAALERAFTHAALAAALRDCRTQLHVAGLRIRFVCPCAQGDCVSVYPTQTDVPCRSDAECAEFQGSCDGQRCFAPLLRDASYDLATTAYLAAGGSGLFDPIAAPPTAAGDGVREAVSEAIRQLPRCVPPGFSQALPCLEPALVARDGRIRFEAP
jgi:5'-nucleotidase / UDP-sugar diphosphatase